jgi:hypothetical protein
MPISFTKYVDITSGVAAQPQIAARNLGGRIFSPNHVFSSDGVYSLTQADLQAFGQLVGTTSEEYLRAVKYFDYVSVKTRRPQLLQFARWQREATSASIYGAYNKAAVLTAIQAITAGTIEFQFGSTTVTVNGIDFAAATTFADVASILETALNANANVNLTTATVTYNAVQSRFEFVASSSQTTYETIGIVSQGGGNTDVALALGWDPSQQPTYVSASPIVTPVNAFIASQGGDNNFGTFLFIANGGAGIALTDAEAIAAQNKTYNVEYKFCVGVNDSTYETWQAGLATIGGTTIIYSQASQAAEYHDMQEMIIEGATDFTQTNGADKYMWAQFGGQTPAVTTDTLSQALDALSINYYGQTQVNGTDLTFYQDGKMQGIATDPLDSNVYANEQWLKSYVTAGFIGLQLALGGISANAQGMALLRGKIKKDVIPAAQNNGVISIGKLLTTDQILDVTELTGDANAWQDVQNKGYWYDLTFQTVTSETGQTEQQAVWTLIYSKDDIVRKVVGSHTLI